MATDTARIQLELASGRNEITAPFHQTAQRRRQLHQQPDAESVDAPEPSRADAFVVDVPASSLPKPEFAGERPGVARPPWLAFGAALIAVGVGVWWVMSQRIPAIDPAVVIERNLNDAESAMAEGRYSDPVERSAFHYYSTVLALDPGNIEAKTGIDAIADRHLTNARLFLEQHRLAEAGVALEKARRVRPDHAGLAALDIQWRAQLRKLLAKSAVVSKPAAVVESKPAVIKKSAPAPAVISEPVAADLLPAAASLESSPSPLQTGAPPTLDAVSDVRTTVDKEAATALAPVGDAPAENAGAAVIPGVAARAGNQDAAAVTPSIAPKLIKRVAPEYPQEALIRGIEGWVEVSLQVSPTGDVIDPRVEESSRGRMFNRAALAAVEQWKYEPRSDSATSERVRVRLQFRQSN